MDVCNNCHRQKAMSTGTSRFPSGTPPSRCRQPRARDSFGSRSPSGRRVVGLGNFLNPWLHRSQFLSRPSICRKYSGMNTHISCQYAQPSPKVASMLALGNVLVKNNGFQNWQKFVFFSLMRANNDNGQYANTQAYLGSLPRHA